MTREVMVVPTGLGDDARMQTDEGARWNGCRFDAGSHRGAYESWFCRANHPSRPLAFWVRYTIFAPRGGPEAAVGELWAVWFDGERDAIVAVKEEHPLRDCAFAAHGLEARIGAARLDGAQLEGSARRGAHTIAWSLRHTSGERPLLLLPERLYDGAFPKAKVVVPAPLTRFEGAIEVDGERMPIDGWVGSQNHNWGSEHTARYAWGQVAGFDDAPDAFLEVSTARVRIGPILTPPMTVLVLRLGEEELRLSSIPRALRARARYGARGDESEGTDGFEWTFDSRSGDVRIEGTLSAPRSRFVALPYGNPPGGLKTCLNSKLARCTLVVSRAGKGTRTLHTASRAAFEILSDDAPPAGLTAL